MRITEEESKKITFKDHEVDRIDWFSKDELLKIYSNPESKITPAGKEIIKELEELKVLWGIYHFQVLTTGLELKKFKFIIIK